MIILYIPAGEFLMGSTREQAEMAYEECGNNCDKNWHYAETPQHTIFLDGYWIDKTEMINAMFARFVLAANYKTDAERVGSGWVYKPRQGWWEYTKGANWRHPRGPGSNIDGMEEHPVLQVSWNDARAYCEWAGGRLPTEAQWEKAARGIDGRIYTWGNELPDNNLLSYNNKVIKDAMKVGKYPKGASPYGVLDMAANAKEWVNDWYDENYYRSSPYRNPQGPANGLKRVERGGNWYSEARSVRVAIRNYDLPDRCYDTLGFRCVRLP
jgi:formylglycine-generating enzyme required for sulfatase activity